MDTKGIQFQDSGSGRINKREIDRRLNDLFQDLVLLWYENQNDKIVFSISFTDDFGKSWQYDKDNIKAFPRTYLNLRMDVTFAERMEFLYYESELPKYGDMPLVNLSGSALQEIWRRIKRLFRKESQ